MPAAWRRSRNINSDADDGVGCDALKEAQKAGFAETDPSFDVEGIDAEHKIALVGRRRAALAEADRRREEEERAVIEAKQHAEDEARRRSFVRTTTEDSN